jgi:hypothetical protein
MAKTHIGGGIIETGNNNEILLSESGVIDRYEYIGGARIPVDRNGRIVVSGSFSSGSLFVIVTKLPEVGEPDKIYLLHKSDEGETGSGNKFTEYIWVNDEWETFGTITLDTSIDLSNYYTKMEVDNLVAAELGGLSEVTEDLEDLL